MIICRKMQGRSGTVTAPCHCFVRDSIYFRSFMRWCVLWSVTKNLRKGWGQIVPTLYVQMQVATGEIVEEKCFLRIIRELCMGAKNNMKKSVKMFV